MELNHWRSELELKGDHPSYREHFTARYPEAYANVFQLEGQRSHLETLGLSQIYLDLVNTIVERVNEPLRNIVARQLQSLQRLTPSALSPMAVFSLTGDQYTAFDLITTTMRGSCRRQGARFFVTGSGGTGKSYLLRALETWFQSRRLTCLKTAPTGIAAININGQTIHSALNISPQQLQGTYKTSLFSTNDQDRLRFCEKVDVLIIDEISMVDATLLDFISQLFRRIKGRPGPFGNIHLVCLGDLMQLPPVSGMKPFQAACWRTFFPIFLRTSCRQQHDQSFATLLEKIRFGQLDPNVRQKLSQRYQERRISHDAYLTTFITSRKAEAQRLNYLLLDSLTEDGQIIHLAEDYENDRRLDGISQNRAFARGTNLPSEIRLVEGAKVMFLNNSLMSDGICNGTCGVVIDVRDSMAPIVAFPTPQDVKVC